MTKVAVITRTKDRPIFLKRSIQSVSSQTYDDYLHVIVNDGGKKSTVQKIIDELPDNQIKKIKLFHRENPSNAPDTIFNESIDHIDSEYVVIHDDDDTWHPEFIERTVKQLELSDAAGVVVKTNKIIEELSKDGTIRQLKILPWMPEIKTVSLYRQCVENQLTPIAFMYRRAAYKDVGGYDSTLPVLGDWDFGIRLLQKYDIDFLDPGFALANYHHRNFKPGIQGNTSYAGNDKARYYTNKLMNKYLRLELAEGRLGVGYIMSKMRYNENYVSTMVGRVLPKFVTQKLKKRTRN